jgi:mono/diheme cytochrome c family protein
MWKTNLKILALTGSVMGFYTGVAHIIPQLESEVPQALDLSAGATPEALVAAGEKVYAGAGGCAACHGLGTRAPNLLTDHAGQGQIGARCGTRQPGKACKAYLYEAMTTPNTYIVPGFEGIMPDMRRQLDDEQIWAVVAYLESQGGEVTVSGSDIKKAAPSAAGAAPASPFAAISDPAQMVTAMGCIGCHQVDGKGGVVGPSFDKMGARISADAIRRGILVPSADTAKGYEKFAGTMPATFGQQLTGTQLEALVQYLARRK